MEKIIWIVNTKRKEILDLQRKINSEGSMKAVCILSGEALKRNLADLCNEKLWQLPSAIIMDSGVALSHESVLGLIRRNVDTIRVPVIFTVPDDREDLRKRCLAMGADDVVVSPVSFERLLDIEKLASDCDDRRNLAEMSKDAFQELAHPGRRAEDGSVGSDNASNQSFDDANPVITSKESDDSSEELQVSDYIPKQSQESADTSEWLQESGAASGQSQESEKAPEWLQGSAVVSDQSQTSENRSEWLQESEESLEQPQESEKASEWLQESEESPEQPQESVTPSEQLNKSENPQGAAEEKEEPEVKAEEQVQKPQEDPMTFLRELVRLDVTPIAADGSRMDIMGATLLGVSRSTLMIDFGGLYDENEEESEMEFDFREFYVTAYRRGQTEFDNVKASVLIAGCNKIKAELSNPDPVFVRFVEEMTDGI